jgi:hypothetical protein
MVTPRAMTARVVIVGTRMNVWITAAGSSAGACRSDAIQTGADSAVSKSNCSGGYV